MSAIQNSDTLSGLLQSHAKSLRCLALASDLLPEPLVQGLQAGPINGDTWCVLVPHSAAAAKMRQWTPAITAHLRAHGLEVQHLRIKVVAA
jgi:hypothetical protein